MGRTTSAVGAALLLLLPGAAVAQNVNMGGTFHGLEARARRVTLAFPDAVIEVRRTDDRGMEGVLRDRGGVVGARLQVVPGARRVRWQHEGRGAPLQEFALPEQATISLDWAGHQLYALHADTNAAGEGRVPDVSGEAGTWDGHLRRNRQVASRGVSSGQLAARLESVETTFDEIVVRATLDRHERRPTAKRVDYSRFTATIHDARTGASRGFVRWFDTAQVLTWKIDGGSQGVILPDRLPGGWTFTPTMPWANVQAYQFATQAARSLEAADPFARGWRDLFRAPASAPPFAQVARAIAPVPSVAWSALSAGLGGVSLPDVPGLPGGWTRPWNFGGVRKLNEEGCDRLHWLDGSVFRACCDDHDRCYEKSGCSERSWFWPFAGSWSCQKCNAQVVYCFCTVSNPAYCGVGEGGDGGSDGGGCTSVAGGFCPIECQTCQAR